MNEEEKKGNIQLRDPTADATVPDGDSATRNLNMMFQRI
jgi:hypothetical protein